MAEKKIIVGLDIGTTKIGLVVAERGQYGEVKILGVGTSPSHGLHRGVVINIDKTVSSIEKAIENAELMSGVKIEEVYAGIAGDHIKSLNSKGIVAVAQEDNEIQESDISRAIDAAKAISLPRDREIIHILPHEYTIDAQDGITDPIGMSGVRLEVDAHIVTGAVTSVQNIVKSVKRAGLRTKDIVLEPLASSYAVLQKEEKELGVGLIDIGGGTTDIALLYGGSIRHTGIISLGGNNVTKDIAIGLKTPPEQAEKIKLESGCCYLPKVTEEEYITVPGVGGRNPRKVSKTILTRIIQPRMMEIFELAAREIKQSDYMEMISAGIVLTGGCSMLDGAAELAEEIFDVPVRIGYPEGFCGLVDSAKSPIYATGVGLVLYGNHVMGETECMNDEDDTVIYDSILERMGSWFKNNF